MGQDSEHRHPSSGCTVTSLWTTGEVFHRARAPLHHFSRKGTGLRHTAPKRTFITSTRLHLANPAEKENILLVKARTLVTVPSITSWSVRFLVHYLSLRCSFPKSRLETSGSASSSCQTRCGHFHGLETFSPFVHQTPGSLRTWGVSITAGCLGPEFALARTYQACPCLTLGSHVGFSIDAYSPSGGPLARHLHGIVVEARASMALWGVWRHNHALLHHV